MATARRKPLTIPQRGEIKGGQCHGWRYLFLGFAVVDGALRVQAWMPFPASLATPAAAAEMPQQMGMVLINGHRYRRPVITVAVVTFDGASCVVPVNELQDVLGDGNEYTVQIKTMRKAEFERMPEFGGW